ncbi:unnamed protein product [Nezara viridula]|uniref:Ig-like domain-containing protein n=1 Tax=Nezara viridula TaxID=85310 RepID=A0A9P0H8E3_NEZVI|nr:unnamed protein product [Nezara viridula]
MAGHVALMKNDGDPKTVLEESLYVLGIRNKEAVVANRLPVDVARDLNLPLRCSAGRRISKKESLTARGAAEMWYSSFDEYQRLTEPTFDNNTVVNNTVQLGGTAFLHCRVRNLGERTVIYFHFKTTFKMTETPFITLDENP